MKPIPITPLDATAELCRRHLIDFVERSWAIVRPGERFIRAWMPEAICLHLEAVARGQIQNLDISICPGGAKSLLACVFFPAWVWTWAPEKQFIFASHAFANAERDSNRTRNIIRSDWYQQTFRQAWQMRDDQDTKKKFENTAGGFREAIGVSGSTGRRADFTVIDDAISVLDSWSDTARETSIRWYVQEFGNRLNSMEHGGRVVIGQRVHEMDLTGYLRSKEGGAGWGKPWQHLEIPTEFDSRRRCSTSIGWRDPRTQDGELAFPQLFSREVCEGEKKRLGPDGWAKQHQQHPAPAGGGMFRAEWWRFWRHAWEAESTDPGLAARTIILPPRFDEQIQSWDMSLRDTASADLVAGGIWGRLGGRFFLRDLDWRRMGPVETMEAVRKMSGAYPDAVAKYIEKAANGPIVIGMLEREVPGMIAVVVQQGKQARAAAVTPFVAAGNVYIPLHAEWRDRFIAEHSAFPNGAHDDAVDMTSQALSRWIHIPGDAPDHPLRRPMPQANVIERIQQAREEAELRSGKWDNEYV